MTQVANASSVELAEWAELDCARTAFVPCTDPVMKSFHSLVGASECMKELYRHIEQAGPSAASILIVGETGTGKELVARTLHDVSRRRSRPYVAVNCAAMPENLVESELFGHEKGAFTGAVARSTGYFEQAHRGTLFLDEVSVMPVSQQVKLLRALQEGRVRRVGGEAEVEVDVRVIAAMNVDPKKAIEEGKLRTDLFYRLGVFILEVPPLRDRPGDVLLLARHFAASFSEAQGKPPARFDPVAARALTQYAWPGNVRELRNAIERAVILAKDGTIRLGDLPAALALGSTADAAPRLDTGSGDEAPERTAESPGAVVGAPGMTVDELKRLLILRTLEATGNNISEASRRLGISARTIYNKIREWNLSPRELAK